MNQAVSASVSSCLTRYHSAPSSLIASLTDLTDDDGFHLSADANLRTQVLMASLFSDDFAPEWHQHQQQQQQQQNGLPPLEASPQMLQPYPGAAHNHFLVQELTGSVCEAVEGSPAGDSMDFDPGSSNFGCATRGWSRQPAAAAAVPPPPSSWLPVTPPKLRLLRHSSSPATLLSHLSGDCHAGGVENRQKFSHRMGSGLARSYDLQEPYLREESSDEMEEDGQFGHNSNARKRCRGKILNQIGSLEVLVAENASIPKQLPGGLLPCNTTPCLARAKRGHATHPRSISERLRRTRISEGIKKLQELVPNIEKQMNTADMLDEAVEYIKCLQRQVQELSNNQVVSSDVKPLLCSSVISETL